MICTPMGSPKELAVVTRRSIAFTLADAPVEVIEIACSFTTTSPSPAMVIFVLGPGLAESVMPAITALASVMETEAVPFEDAWAVAVITSAVIVPFNRFTCWIMDELLAFATDVVICPKAVSVMVPVLPTTGTFTLARLTVEFPPGQPMVASAQGPLDTNPEPTLATADRPYALAETEASIAVRVKLV